MIFRIATNKIVEDLDLFPVVAIIGSRQVGKTTLAKTIGQHLKKRQSISTLNQMMILPN